MSRGLFSKMLLFEEEKNMMKKKEHVYPLKGQKSNGLPDL